MRATASAVVTGAFVAAVGLAAVTAAPALADPAPAPAALVATTTQVVASPTELHPYQPLQLAATVTSAVAGVTPTGAVAFTRGTQTLCARVTVDPTSGRASCTVTGPLAVGTTGVTATFTPTVGGAVDASTGRAPLTVTRWTPRLVVSLWGDDAACGPSFASIHLTVRPPAGAAAAAAVAAGLPTPTGTVSTNLPSSVSVPLTGGVGRQCLPLPSTSTWTYSGDASYASLAAASTLDPAHTPRGGSGAPPTVTPSPTAPSTSSAASSAGAPVLAATGPGSPAGPALLLGLGLVAIGGAVVVGGRVRRGS